jgi:predicted branched-subunit amino acid permease
MRRRREELRLGAMAALPMIVGLVPFGLVAGAAPFDGGLGTWAGPAFSVIVFAGASQLAAINVLAEGGSWAIAAIAACTINLRLLLYSASLAPHMARFSLRDRFLAAYVLTDQAYAVSIARWSAGATPSLAYYFGGAMTLWVSWQAATLAGAFGGGLLSDDVPLEFAVPLVFLVLLIPAVTTRPAVAAMVAGGGAAVAALELGAGGLYILIGALVGIATGAFVEAFTERRTPLIEADL